MLARVAAARLQDAEDQVRPMILFSESYKTTMYTSCLRNFLCYGNSTTVGVSEDFT